MLGPVLSVPSVSLTSFSSQAREVPPAYLEEEIFYLEGGEACV